MIQIFKRWAEERRAIVLWALDVLNAPLTLFEIEWRVEAASGTTIFVWTGGVRRVLRALEEDGLLSSREVSTSIEFPTTRYYELTDLGRAERRAVNDGRIL